MRCGACDGACLPAVHDGKLTGFAMCTCGGCGRRRARSVLEDTKLSPARAGAVAAAYADLRTDVRARLARTAPTFPHITDVKWRLDYYVKVRARR